MKFLMLIFSIAVLSACSSAMTPQQVDAFVKADKKHGFLLQGNPSANSYIIAFQSAGMKQAWSMVVAVIGQDKKNNFELVSVGTTLWRGKAEPSKEMMAFLLQMNSVDNNIGTLSFFKQEGEFYVQYFIRRPLSYLTEKELEFDIGYVAGYADALAAKLQTMK
jgi:hypothetical protein